MTLKFVVKQKLYNNDIINVFHYAENGGVNSGDAQEIVDAIALAYSSRLSALQTQTYTFEGISFYDTDNPPGTPGIDFTPTQGNHAGTLQTTAAANQLAVLVNWKCQQGPPFRGRSYMAGWSEGLMGDVGNITQGIITALDLWADDMKNIALSGGNTAQLVIVSTGSNIVPAGTEAVVTNHSVNNFPKTQRRRALGTGS